MFLLQALLADRLGMGSWLNNTRVIVDTLSLLPPKFYSGIKVKRNRDALSWANLFAVRL